jgi:rsbT co-antagonist protein RsbR
MTHHNNLNGKDGAMSATPREENAQLRQHIAELEQQLESERTRVEQIGREKDEQYRRLIESLNVAYYRSAMPSGQYEYFSPTIINVFGYGAEDFLATPGYIGQIMHPDFIPYFQEKWNELLKGIVEPTYDYKVIDPEGNERWISQTNQGIFDAAGNLVGIEGICSDMTRFREQEQERLRMQQELIDAQETVLRELSTPLLPIADGVLAMPLVGTIDSNRAQMVMESLLEGVAYYQAEVAILDITGVKVIDTQVADALMRTAQAVRLLGASVVLTGIQPGIAQTLVHLGVDLSGIVTRSTLQSGIAYALSQA